MFAQFSHRIAVITATSALLAASTFAYPLHTTAEPIAEDAIAHEYDYLEIPEDPFDETGEHLSPDLDIDDPDLDEDTTTPTEKNESTEKSADPATELELSDLPQASGPLQCTPGNFYSLASHSAQAGKVYHIEDTGKGFTPSTEPLVDFSTLLPPNNPDGRLSKNVPTRQPLNGLAIGDDGKKAYAVHLELPHKVTKIFESTGIYQWDATTNKVTVGTYFNSTPIIRSRFFIAGGTNPANDDKYYFGGYKAVLDKGKYEIRFHLFMYDPATQQVGHLGYVVAYKTFFYNELHNGDLAFDQDGNMYILYHNPTYNVVRVIPVTAESLAEAEKHGAVYADEEKPLSTANENYEIASQNVRDLDKFQRIGGTYNGLAFAADGNMYAETTNFGSGTVTIQKLDSNSGSTLYSGTGNRTWTMGLDLASCIRIPTVELKKNIISRDKPTDQFKLDIFREDLGTTKDKELTSATTTGSSTGIQKEYAGPIPAIVGKRYRIQESGTANEGAISANLDHYRSSVTCTNEETKEKIELTEVPDNTRAWTFEVPDSAKHDHPLISCTYTNEASGDIKWKKISEKDADKSKDKASGLAGSTWELRKQGDPKVLATIEDFICTTPTSADCLKKIKEQNRLSELDYADTNPAAGEFLVPRLPYGSYTLTETKAPEGYLLRKDPIEFTIDDSSERPYPVNGGVITNKPSQAEISWEKVDENSKPLDGSSWKLIPIINGKRDETKAITVKDNDEKDANKEAGHFTLKDIPLGKYVLIETKAPTGYRLSKPVEKEVEVSESKNKVDLGKIENIPARIEWEKVDSKTSQPLAGSVWTLTYPNNKEVTIEDCTTAPCKGPDLDPTAGKFSIVDPGNGRYTLKEKTAPAGYSLRKETISLELKEDGYTISGIGDEVSRKWQVDSKERVISLNIGKITNDKSTAHLSWRKLAAATPEQKAETLLGGSEWTLVPVKDGKADEKNAITIVDKTNTNEGVRDENATAGEFLVKDIEVGTYLLRETKAPAGYQISEELRNGVEVTITSDQTGTTIKLKDQYNKPITGNVIWQKIDPEKNALTGSVWTIVKVTEDHKPIAGQEAIRIEDCTEQACTGYDKDAVGGKFRVENLEFGTYKLQEVQAPAGYKLEKKEHYFTISEQGVVDAGSFVNHIGRGINLPLTGGRGSYIFILFALGISAISLISAGTFLKRRRG